LIFKEKHEIWINFEKNLLFFNNFLKKKLKNIESEGNFPPGKGFSLGEGGAVKGGSVCFGGGGS